MSTSEGAGAGGKVDASPGVGRPSVEGAPLTVSRLVERGPDRRRMRPSVLSEAPPGTEPDSGPAVPAREDPVRNRGIVPPGWPPQVRPPGTTDWMVSAGAWLLDQCPADYRAYPVWRRHPMALAWVASLHVAAQLEAMREAFRRVRVDLADDLDPEVVTAARTAIETEGLRLRAVQRGVDLVLEAMRGEVYVPRL